MRQCAEHGALVMVHAEDDDLIKHMEAKLRREGRNGLENVHLVHTLLGEELAVRAYDRLAEEAGAALYVVHVGGRRAARRDRRGARRRPAGLRRGAPQHALLLDRGLREAGRREYHIGMGLKAPGNQEPLWAALADGDLSTLATDEYTTSYAVKMAGTDLETTPGGHVGIETRGIDRLLGGLREGPHVAGALRGRLLREPGQADGPLPAQGRDRAGERRRPRDLGSGRRADDHAEDLHHESDYSPWEGWEVRGWPVATVLRGKVVVEDGSCSAARTTAAGSASPRPGDRGGDRRCELGQAPSHRRRRRAGGEACPWGRSRTSSRARATSGRRPASAWSSRSRSSASARTRSRGPSSGAHADGRHGHPRRHEPVLLRPDLGGGAR